ncbi:MAG: hypothetical protein GY809_04055 [Planctomycetes bacterium]|nr:hypothetical protein [Planctomycetota bacterium]
MKIDRLCAENKNHPINKRYSPDRLACYERDLRRVVKLVKEGRCMPTRRELHDYFLDELGMDITTGSIHRHINLIKAGKQIWA